MCTDLDEAMMREALLLAREAAADGEVPVGCVITLEDRIVGRGRNRREKGKTALAHAELEAIGEACRTLGGWRLWQCTLYVTLEPVPHVRRRDFERASAARRLRRERSKIRRGGKSCRSAASAGLLSAGGQRRHTGSGMFTGAARLFPNAAPSTRILQGCR